MKIEFIPHENLADHFLALQGVLAHKPPTAHWFLEEVLKLDPRFELRMDSFVAVDGAKWVGNINVFHFAKMGLVGNVFLKEEYRGRGIGSDLMNAIEVWARNQKHLIHVLWVDPKKRPVAFRLYQKHGYEVRPQSGIMIRNFSKESPFSTVSKLKAVRLSWRHYPQLNAITSLGLADRLTSFLHSCYGHATFEWEFLKALQDPTEQAWAFENENGIAVGAAFLKKDPLWEQQRERNYQNTNYLFDAFVETKHAKFLGEVLAEIDFPAGRISTYAEKQSAKFEGLSKFFSPILDLKEHFEWQGHKQDVTLMMRR